VETTAQAVYRNRSCGDPVLERWRPGGSVLAIMGRGHKHTLACRPVTRALATTKQSNKAHITAQVSVRTKGTVGESARAEETAIPPELAKDAAVNVLSTVVRAWGWWMAPRGF